MKVYRDTKDRNNHVFMPLSLILIKVLIKLIKKTLIDHIRRLRTYEPESFTFKLNFKEEPQYYYFSNKHSKKKIICVCSDVSSTSWKYYEQYHRIFWDQWKPHLFV